MIISLPIALRQPKVSRLALALLLFYALVLVYALRMHIMWHSINVWLGVIALPVVAIVRPTEKASFRFGWMALVLAVLCCWLPVKTLLFLALSLSVLFVIECFWGRINLLLLFVIGMMSPIFQYAADVFSFPIRLWLTGVAGALMNRVGLQTVVNGNVIQYGGHEFSVDPACMGLNMLVTSLLLQALLITVYQKRYNNALKSWLLLPLMGFVLLLNILSNLIRIVFLVQFNILPGSTMHEITGLLCLLVYVILPAMYVTRWIVRKSGKNKKCDGLVIMYTPVYKTTIMQLLVVVCIGTAAWSVVQRDNNSSAVSEKLPAISGYRIGRVAGDVIKLENDKSLVYIKSIAGFYSADHHPMICWRGSGYEFKRVEERTINGMAVYAALLQKGSDQLYTAWWYDSGTKQTIEQLAWRRDALQNGKKYAVVNVTAASNEKLNEEIQKIQQQRPFQELLGTNK